MSGTPNKTQPTTQSVAAFINAIEDPQLRAEGKRLVKLFRSVTGAKPVLRGSIIGFGSYHYTYASGREGDFLATGFALRKSGPTLYIMPGYDNYQQILQRLGPHRRGKSCLYLKRLADVDETVLQELIAAGLHDLQQQYPVTLK